MKTYNILCNRVFAASILQLALHGNCNKEPLFPDQSFEPAKFTPVTEHMTGGLLNLDSPTG